MTKQLGTIKLPRMNLYQWIISNWFWVRELFGLNCCRFMIWNYNIQRLLVQARQRFISSSQRLFILIISLDGTLYCNNFSSFWAPIKIKGLYDIMYAIKQGTFSAWKYFFFQKWQVCVHAIFIRLPCFLDSKCLL